MSSLLDLDVERPVAGGRMLARDDGRVVLVSGAIPGERVRVEIERRSRDVSWARVVEVLTSSVDRRASVADPSCGGLSYAHIAYDAQRRLKAEIIADAFRRLGKIAIEDRVVVEPSPERGYRLRARLHVDSARFGFFREGTHAICDAALTEQLRPDAIAAVGEMLDRLGAARARCAAVVVAENVTATERVLHLEPRPGATFDNLDCSARPVTVSGVTTTGARGRIVSLGGVPVVVDDGGAWLDGAWPGGPPAWRRHALAFFQSNRFLVGPLLRHVLDEMRASDVVADFYAGVGLFSVALAARGHAVTAVEGDDVSGGDLRTNATPWPRLSIVCDAVERAAARMAPGSIGAALVDPPRTGMSVTALSAILALGASRVVYVSCDPPTLARDAARLVSAGYRVARIHAFDLFPNTPHVETVVTFARG